MNIVQTFWSCNKKNLFNTNFGWLSPEYNIISWALSCLQLKHFYKNVTLYADSVATKLLIDSLELPYTNVVCNLDDLNEYHAGLWALPKIYTYSKQDAPFLHIDGDVYIWKAFENKLLAGDLIAQNQEAGTEYYENKIQHLEKYLTYLPKEITEDRKACNPIHAYNAGIFGGGDIEFFKSYTHKAFEFVNNNINSLSKINVTDFNIFFEQYLFYCMVKKQNKKVNVLFDQIIGDNEYTGFGDFNEVPHNKQYLHLLGVYKKNKDACLQLANRLRQDYPEYYYRIISLFKKGKLPLFKDYYYSVNKVNQEDLLCRSNYLKKAYRSNGIPITDINNKGNLEKHTDRYTAIKIAIINYGALQNMQHSNEYNLLLNDIQQFEKYLSAFIKNKLTHFSNEYLYARDVTCTKYFQTLFDNKPECSKELIVKDDIVEIINSCFDWSKFDQSKMNCEAIIKYQLSQEPATVYTAIIPECDLTGYSLINIDELDILLLDTLKKPLSINQLMDELKPAFDDEDLNNSVTEFELLITGRIKYALQHKMIKCIVTQKLLDE